MLGETETLKDAAVMTTILSQAIERMIIGAAVEILKTPAREIGFRKEAT